MSKFCGEMVTTVLIRLNFNHDIAGPDKNIKLEKTLPNVYVLCKIFVVT